MIPSHLWSRAIKISFYKYATSSLARLNQCKLLQSQNVGTLFLYNLPSRQCNYYSVDKACRLLVTFNCFKNTTVHYNNISLYHTSTNQFLNRRYDRHSYKSLLELSDPYPLRFLSGYSHDNTSNRNYFTKKTSVNYTHKNLAFKKQLINNVIRDKQKKIRQTQQRLKSKGRLLLNNIKETKSRMKEKMEEIIERENIWTIPNFLCVARILASPYIGYVIMDSNYYLALGLVTIAGITDILDGTIARNLKNQSSNLGSFLDPMADKVLIATLFLTLTVTGNMPVPLTVLIVTRDVLLATAGFYIRYQSLPPPKTLNRYFDMTHATAQLSPTTISKLNTTVQLVTVVTTLAAAAFKFTDHPALYCLWYFTAFTTTASAISYLTTKNTYKLLKKK